MWTSPKALEIVVAHISLLINWPAEICGMMSLGIELPEGRWTSLVLVSRAGNLLTRSAFENSWIIARPGVAEVWLNKVRLRGAGERSWVVAVHNLWMGTSQQDIVLLCLGRLSCLCSTGALLSSKISFGKALFSRLGFPIVIANSSTVDNHTASKLSEHWPGGNDGNLPGTIREGKDFLRDQIILFCLAGDNLE
jgi:hypothetical protein